jgi:transposase
MGFIFNDRRQQKLLGYCLSDFVANNDKSHMVVDIVSKLDLTELYNRYSNQGNDAYDPKTLLATWFFAYSEGESSTRKIENLCRYELRFIYVSADLRPDHTTLSRFRKRHLDLMADYFVQILLLAKEADISDFKEISIYGTKIKASCSKKQSYKEDQLNRKIEAIRRDIAEYMSRCDLAEDEEDVEDLESILHKGRKIERSDFIYNCEEDYYECPAGERLKPLRSYNNGKSHGKIYQCLNCSERPFQLNSERSFQIYYFSAILPELLSDFVGKSRIYANRPSSYQKYIHPT